MFVLAEMKDTVKIKPWHFGTDLREAISDKLNNKLANKVCHTMLKKALMLTFHFTHLLNVKFICLAISEN